MMIAMKKGRYCLKLKNTVFQAMVMLRFRYSNTFSKAELTPVFDFPARRVKRAPGPFRNYSTEPVSIVGYFVNIARFSRVREIQNPPANLSILSVVAVL